MIQLQYVWIRNYESPRTIAPHQHTCYEFIYYLKGSGNGIFGEEKYFYSPGSFVSRQPQCPSWRNPRISNQHDFRRIPPAKSFCNAT